MVLVISQPLAHPRIIQACNILNSPDTYARQRGLIHAMMPLTNPSSKSSKLEAATAQSAKDNADEYMTAVPSSTIATVPGYWLIALRNHVGLSELITDRE
jgi:hypothetical protein